MPFILFFLSLVVFYSYVELSILVYAGTRMGLMTVIGLCLLTGIVGGAMVRRQGLSTLVKIQQTMAQGKVPTTSLFEGLILLATGLMLITPGFVTDVIGFMLLIPALRTSIAKRFAKVGLGRIHMHGRPTSYGGYPPASHRHDHPRDPDVIDVEAEDRSKS